MNIKKKILVTGSGGFIGRHLVSELINLGHDVICVDLIEIDTVPLIFEARQYLFDISDYKNFDVIQEDVDMIFHLAGQSTGSISMVNHERDVDWNAKGTANICHFARRKNVDKIVYTSTMAVYGNGSFKKETDDLNPLSNYGVTKLAGEFYIKTLRQYGIDHSIYRLWNTYGPGQNMKNPKNCIVSCFLQQALESREINVTGSFDRYRDVIYIDDTVSGILTGLQLASNNETFNVCNKVEISVKEMIDGILSVHDCSDTDFKVVNVGSHDGDQSGSSGDNSKLRNIGWVPRVSYEEGIRRFYEYEKQKR